MALRLAIASPLASAYSETFVAMQMERLPCVLRIHGSSSGTVTEPGGPIRPMGTWRGLFEAIWCTAAGRDRSSAPRQAVLAGRLRKHRVNRILANFGPAAVELLPVSRRLSIPLVAHFHGFDAHQHQIIERHADGYRDVGRHAAAVIAVSGSMVDALCASGVPREKIHLARCGVDPVAFPARDALPTGAPLFFGVGRFVDKKAPYLTLLAFAEARKRLPGATLVLGGTGELLEATRNLSRALNLETCVSFPGVLSPAEVAAWMQKATAFVQHSLEPLAGPARGDREGTPVTILEAMMTGVPVISTRHGGIPEVITPGENGLLVDERDVAGMAEAMVAIAIDPTLAGRLGAAARSRALLRHTADEYITSLQKVLELAAGTPPLADKVAYAP